MRPRFMNRGSRENIMLVGPSGSGFNEAPIHESGKCRAGEGWSSRTVPLQ